jgi:uncharacterized protein (TIGR00251 family)
MANLDIQQLGDAVVFTVKVVPGSSKTEIGGLLNGMVKIRISTAPEKGKANKTLIGFLAKKLGVKSKAITIISGHKTTVKRVRVVDARAEEVAKIMECSNGT